MIRINHDDIEIDGTKVADFRPGFPLYLRDEFRGLVESALETDYLFEEGDLISTKEYEKLESENARQEDIIGHLRYALETIETRLKELCEIPKENTKKNIREIFEEGGEIDEIMQAVENSGTVDAVMRPSLECLKPRKES